MVRVKGVTVQRGGVRTRGGRGRGAKTLQPPLHLPPSVLDDNTSQLTKIVAKATLTALNAYFQKKDEKKRRRRRR
ncbi:uncharacterized protein LOC127285072 isoform X2 [Leptopilina boulardi]|uniref:uncharacterized protein LOC127285072 isoform X2 n=1 Tax=Leptopilina boulardi TaxID=63433 RepID=UPI0021F563CB|nr:uncharacterized protein LOC127285072 isoform X2 [Leptopilina boulardi]